MLNQACFSLFVELLGFTQLHVKERESCTAIQSYAKKCRESSCGGTLKAH